MTPRGVAMDDKSELYVADAGNDRVQVLAPDGQPLLAKLRLKPTRGCLMLGSGTIDVVHPSLSGGADDVTPQRHHHTARPRVAVHLVH
jgi:sugar lactone lactonase YvrE